MPATIYGLRTCDSCRRALKALPGAVLVDVRADPLTRDQLASWYAEFGADLVNRRSTTWTRLTGTERAEAETADGAVDLLLRHPALMKRPVIAANGIQTLGWNAETRAAHGAA